MPGGDSIKVDRFDENLISSDNMLRLNIGEDTMVTDRNDDPYEGELAGKLLYVLYGSSTRSIPAQTTPTVVTVM